MNKTDLSPNSVEGVLNSNVAEGVAISSRAVPNPKPNSLKVRTVLFVEQTKGVQLAKGLRGVVDRLAPMLGFKIKIQEKGGTKLQDLMSNKNLWAREKCGRGECAPCGQNIDRVQDCTARNIVYESRCGICNPGGETGLKSLADGRELPSIYVGETSRSLKERAGEHFADFSRGTDDSHMMKHCSMSHRNEKPNFNQFVVGKFKTALGRQVGEAIRIQMRGNILNSTGVYNRCRLTRLVIDSQWDKKEYGRKVAS